jgi:cyclase
VDTSVTGTSRHFQLEAVAGGVYAAIASAGGGAMSNAAIVDLGESTLIFDTFFTPQAAADLRAVAEQLTGRPVRYVLNSHFHGDHVQGNQAFPGADILATRRTRELIAERTAPTIASHQEDPQRITDDLRQQEEAIEREADLVRRRQRELSLATDREYAAALPGLSVPLPVVTFDSRVELHGTTRRAEFITLGGGHTPSDAFLYLPEDQLIITGDLLFVRSHPWMGHGHPEEWLAILERLESLPAQTLVPGHGPLGTLADCARVRRYIADITELARGALRAGKTPDDMAALPIPAAYAEWDSPEVFGWNMRFLRDYLSETTEQPEES